MQRLSVVRVKHIELDGDGTRAARPQDPDDVGVAGMGDGLGSNARMAFDRPLQ
jgi:hypothetical protein